MSAAAAIVMAAGKGTRMQSDLPKVLFEVCGRPMIHYVLESLAAGGASRQVVVVGYRGELVRETLSGYDVEFVEQTEQLGTGHAVMVCRQALADHDGPVVIVAGDSPMLRSDSIAALLEAFQRDRPACLLGSAYKSDPTGLGRIVRDAEGNFLGIVEQRDATPEQAQIQEVNLSCYVFNCQDLFDALDQIEPNNSQGEYYITDCPGVLLAAGKDVRALAVLQPSEALSINNLQELAIVEAAMRDERS